MRSLFASFILVTTYYSLFTSCTTVDVFEKNVSLPKQEWSSSLKPEINIEISDTASLYHIYFVIRHTDAYRYNNIWINIYTLFPGDSSMRKQRFDILLATDNKGWLGSGMDDIFEHRYRLTQNQPVRFPRPGSYKFVIENIMRDDPLPEILNVGIRVEKAK